MIVDWPDRVDPAQGTATLVSTTVDRLRAAAFLDGRTPVADAPGRAVPITALPAGPASPVATLLHVSFCGSTLLSRLLDVPGRTLSLREPRVQVDLADWRAAVGRADVAAPLAHAIRGTTTLLGRAIAGQRVVVKPTNWANVLLPDWTETPAAIDPVFLTMAPHAFLVAVFRGGRERIGFTMRGAVHFARMRPDGAAIIDAALAESVDPLDRAARLTVVALACQHTLFADARMRGGWGEERVIDFATLRTHPVPTVLRVARLLGLPLDADHIATRLASLATRDAKAPDRPFAATNERDRDADVLHYHAARIEAALRWGERAGLV